MTGGGIQETFHLHARLYWFNWKCMSKLNWNTTAEISKSCSLLLFELTYVWMIQYLHYSDFPEELLRDKGAFYCVRMHMEGHNRRWTLDFGSKTLIGTVTEQREPNHNKPPPNYENISINLRVDYSLQQHEDQRTAVPGCETQSEWRRDTLALNPDLRRLGATIATRLTHSRLAVSPSTHPVSTIPQPPVLSNDLGVCCLMLSS